MPVHICVGETGDWRRCIATNCFITTKLQVICKWIKQTPSSLNQTSKSHNVFDIHKWKAILNRKQVYLQVCLSCINIKILEHHSHQASVQYCTYMKKIKQNQYSLLIKQVLSKCLNLGKKEYAKKAHTKSCHIFNAKFGAVLPVVWDVHDRHPGDLPDPSL